jgi:hypothetical protein
MKRFSRHYILIFSILYLSNSSAQYEGLDSTRKQAYEKTEEAPFVDEITVYRYKDLAYSGLDFTLFGGGLSNSLEIAPFTGLHFNDKVYTAIGLSGSLFFINQFNNNIFTTTGSVFTFVRVPISNVFIHLEYRLQNGVVNFQNAEREWYQVPILAGGYNNDGRLGMYALVGVAFNPRFALTNSLGPFIYRFGFRF